MRKLALIIIITVALSACNKGNSANKNGLNTDVIEHSNGSNAEPKMEFEETSWDFGTITEGDYVEHSFKFKNTGDDDLVISNVTSSCGCTIPEWPRNPIKPGDEGKIKVQFNSEGKKDLVTKEVNIFANTNPVKTVLTIKTKVVKK